MQFVILCLAMLFSISVFAQTKSIYTGKAENIQKNDRGITFEVVVRDEQGKELFRREQFVSGGVFDVKGVTDAVKNVVERMTQEVWAHREVSDEVFKKHKAELESFSVVINSYVPVDSRPDVKDVRQ